MRKRHCPLLIGFIAILVCLGGVFVVHAVGTLPIATRGDQQHWTYAEIVIEPGDTLWALARQFNPQEDPRDMVSLIREINQLQEAVVYPGQKLMMPLAEEMAVGS